jgi:hypothetical protein
MHIQTVELNTTSVSSIKSSREFLDWVDREYAGDLVKGISVYVDIDYSLRPVHLTEPNRFRESILRVQEYLSSYMTYVLGTPIGVVWVEEVELPPSILDSAMSPV